MTDTNDTHETSVRRVNVGVGRRDGGTGVRYQATCSICGPLGPREVHPEDVQCIADRHAAIQGFER